MKLNRAARVGITCTAALSLSLTLTGAAGGAEHAQDAAAVDLVRIAAAAFPAVAALPESVGLKTPVMLHGTLKNSAGKPLSGAQVMLSAWPMNEVLNELTYGETFDVTPVARTITDANGRYELRSALTPLLASLTGRDGLDLQVNVFHGKRHYVSLAQVTPDQDFGAWVRQLTEDPNAEQASKNASGRNALDFTFDPEMGQRIGPDHLRLPVRLPGDPPPAAPGCSRNKRLGQTSVLAEVVSAYARNGATVSTTYKSKAKTESSMGSSADGGVHWSAGTAISRTSGIEGKWKTVKSKRGGANGAVYSVYWLHKVTEMRCHKDMTGQHLRYSVVSSPTVAVGSEPPKEGAAGWTCPAYTPGDTLLRTFPVGFTNISTENERAKTFTAAFSFAPTGKGALTGSTTSGYSQAVKVTFNYKDKERAYWCGDTAHPRARGQVLQGFQL
jgi:hypothetical protein